jgi:uncharacterized protein DUF5670
MLAILGILMLLLWFFHSASHVPAGSLIHLLLILACVSFVAEFLRTRTAALWEYWTERPPRVVAAIKAVKVFRRSVGSQSSPSK